MQHRPIISVNKRTYFLEVHPFSIQSRVPTTSHFSRFTAHELRVAVNNGQTTCDCARRDDGGVPQVEQVQKKILAQLLCNDTRSVQRCEDLTSIGHVAIRKNTVAQRRSKAFGVSYAQRDWRQRGARAGGLTGNCERVGSTFS